MRVFSWLLLAAAIVQFVGVGFPPGNADLISIQSLALDLRRGDVSILYPGRDFARNDDWVDHHEQNLRHLRTRGEPNWCFYPPLVPQLLVPFAEVSPETWRILWGAIQLGLVAVFVLLLERLLKNEGANVHRVLLAALVLGSYPVARSLQLGQTSLLIAVLVWLGVYAAQGGRTVLSVSATGLAVFVKPFVLLTVVPDVFRKRVLSAVSIVAVAGGLMVISLMWVGGQAHAEYWNLLNTLASSQTAYFGNQSLMAGFMRAFTSLPVMEYGFRPDAALAILSKAVALAVVMVAFVIQCRTASANPVLLAGLWLSAALLALPISWEHHLIFVLPALAFLWTGPQPLGFRIMLAAATLLLEVRWLPFYSDYALGRVAASLPLLGNLVLFVLIAHHLLKPINPRLAGIKTTS